MQMSFTGERYVPELRGQIYYEHFHRYSATLELARDRDVLDIASGEGYGTAVLALVARSVLGVDSDPAAVCHAAARYAAMNLDFRVGEASRIPAGDASVDLVVSFETIEHLADHERMLAEIKRVLRPDGRLVMSSPNKLVYSDERSYTNPFHVRELYFHEFRDLLRGFFPEVRVFGQRIFAASAVHALRGSAERTRWLGPSTTGESGIAALPDPEYFLAVCGKTAGDALPDLSSVYLDPRDELLHDVRAGGLTAVGPQREAAPQAALVAGPDDDSRGQLEAALRANESVSAELERIVVERDAARLAHADVVIELERRTRERDEARHAHEAVFAEVSRERDEARQAHASVAAELERVAREHTETREALEEARAEMRRLGRSGAQSHLELDAAQATAEELRGQVRALQDAHRQTERYAAQVQLERENLREALEQAELTLQSLIDSRSWRMTKPVRRVMGMVRTARRKGEAR